MNKELFIFELRKEIQQFPFIPFVLLNYLENVIANGVEEELLPALLEPRRSQALIGINRMFKEACEACDMELSEFICALGIKPKDTVYGSLDAMFAIVRTINGLRIWGFHNIRPLKAGNKKRADIYCEYNNIRCVVEVFCSLERYFRYPDHEKPANNLEKYFMARAIEKKEQVDTTAIDMKCEIKIFALVLNSMAAQATLLHNDFIDSLKSISTTLSWGENYHYILITGRKDAFTNVTDDAIYPPLD
jgi:hypothetical protein